MSGKTAIECMANPIKTREDVEKRGNYFANVDGGYPAGMSTCYVVGLSGDCGFDCPDFTDGICEQGEEKIEDYEKETGLKFDDLEIKELYI